MKISVSKTTEKPKLRDLNVGEIFVFEDQAYSNGEFLANNAAMVVSGNSYVYLSSGVLMSVGQDEPVIILDAELLVKEREV